MPSVGRMSADITSTAENDRKRVNSVNAAFSRLRCLIPTRPSDRRLSKIETLRLACGYISHLNSQLNCHEDTLVSECCAARNLLSDSKNAAQMCTFCVNESRLKKRSGTTSNSALNNCQNSHVAADDLTQTPTTGFVFPPITRRHNICQNNLTAGCGGCVSFSAGLNVWAHETTHTVAFNPDFARFDVTNETSSNLPSALPF